MKLHIVTFIERDSHRQAPTTASYKPWVAVCLTPVASTRPLNSYYALNAMGLGFLPPVHATSAEEAVKAMGEMYQRYMQSATDRPDSVTEHHIEVE